MKQFLHRLIKRGRDLRRLITVKQSRRRLRKILAEGLSDDARKHAEQIGAVAGVLSDAFESIDLEVVVVGGSAIEIHTPGGYVSGDLDVIIQRRRGIQADPQIAEMFSALGFERKDRHWLCRDLWVDVPGVHVDGPVEFARVGSAVFRIIRKEEILAERVVGFKHWPGGLAYGQQAITMLVALRGELDWDWLRERTARESALDALEELDSLAERTSKVSESTLQEAQNRLRGK